MSSTKKCDIFISYRRDGGDMTAMYIYQALKDRKYDIFYDLEVLRAGRFNDSLLEYIGSCQDFILVLSPGSLDRCREEGDWVRREIAEALRLKKNIIPVMLKGFKFPDNLPEDIDDVRYQNGLTATTEYFQESMNRLCEKYLKTKPKKNVPVIAGIAGGAALILILGILFGKSVLFPNKPEPNAVVAISEKTTERANENASDAANENASDAANENASDAANENASEAADEETEAKAIETAAAETEALPTVPVSDTNWPAMRNDSPWELYDNKYICDSEENEFYGFGNICNMPVFQNEALLRKDVRSITFLNTLENAGADAWDISEAQDGSVLAWTEKNGELSDLFIAGKGGVNAPEDCPGLFALYQNVESISFNGCLDTSNSKIFDGYFAGCTSLKTLDLRTLDTSEATNFGALFFDCENLTSIDLSQFNTSRAMTMGSMFYGLRSLKTLDLSSFHTSRVTEMSHMFAENNKLKKLILGDGFDTSRVNNMEGMFQNNSNLMELDVSGFQTSKVDTMKGMFAGCYELLELNVSNFDTSKVQSMEEMFMYCDMLDGLDVSGWNTDSVRNTRNMFTGCDSLTDIGTTEGKIYEELCKTKNQKYSRLDMFFPADTEHFASVRWYENEDPVICAYSYDESSGHSYLFVNCPATAGKANWYWGDTDCHLVTINSKEELEFLRQWAQNDGLNFHESWIMGNCNVGDVYREYDPEFDLKSAWKDSWQAELPNGKIEHEMFFNWANGQPDGSGQWLQFLQEETEGKTVLYMDDVNDDVRRPFILEFDRKLEDGEDIDLSWNATGGDVEQGYGEPMLFADGSGGRLDEKGRLVVSGTGATSMICESWYNPYIYEIVVKEGMKEIGDHTFENCWNLTSVTLPESLEKIGEFAFAYTGLTSVTIPSGVKKIGFHTFDGCWDLTSVTLPEGLESIDQCAFSGTGLTSITIPESVTKIDDAAFDGIEQDLTICGESGSYAEKFAKNKGIVFQVKPVEIPPNLKSGKVSVFMEKGDVTAAECLFAYDEAAEVSYVYIDMPMGRMVLDGKWDGGKLVTIESKDDLRFLTAWAQKEMLNFNETWIQGLCSPGEIDPNKPEKAWRQVESAVNRYLEWDDGQPDGSGQWLQLLQHENNGNVVLKMDDVFDGRQRGFILEFDRELKDGEIVELKK